MEPLKKYQYINFPNNLSPLEMYYFLLKEFNIIPLDIPTDKIEAIFRSAASDYLNHDIDESTFSTIANNLYFSGNIPQVLKKENSQLADLLDSVSELGWDIKNNKNRFNTTVSSLQAYLK